MRSRTRTWSAAAVVFVMAVAVPLFTSGGVPAPPSAAYADADVTEISGAILFFETKIADDPTNPLAAAKLVNRYVKRFQLAADLADIERAEALARELLDRDRDRVRAHARLSSVLLARHAFAEALLHAERAVAEDRDHDEAWGALYDAAFAIGRYDLAERALTRLEPGSVARKAREAFWLDARGYTGMASARLREACDRIDGWSGRTVAAAWCRTELGHIALDLHGARAAAAWYGAALEVEPGYRGAVEGLADIAHDAGDWKTAGRLYRRIAVDAHPDLYLRLAEVERALGNTGAAAGWERAFTRVTSPPEVEPLYAHPLALFLAEHPETRDRALEIALREVDRRPTAESWEVLAEVRSRRGEVEEALVASDRATVRGAR